MTGSGVLVLAGPPCAGKSAVAAVLASGRCRCRHRLVRVEVDALFSLLLPASDRNPDDRMLAYDAAHVVAGMLLERGQTPMLECTYSRLPQRVGLLRALATSPAAPLWVVELAVTPGVALQRFRQRHQATDLTEQLVLERASTFPYSDCALHLDSSGAAPEDLAQQVCTWLREGPQPVDRDVWAAQARKPD